MLWKEFLVRGSQLLIPFMCSGFGVAVQATDTISNDLVVVKIMIPSNPQEGQNGNNEGLPIEKAIDEARFLQRSPSKYTVSYYESFYDGMCFFVMCTMRCSSLDCNGVLSLRITGLLRQERSHSFGG